MTALGNRGLPQPRLVSRETDDVLEHMKTGTPLVSRETASSPEPVELPEWAKILGDTTKTGDLAAKAIAIDFEKAAREIETLGVELLNIAKAHDEMMERLKAAIAEVHDTATRYRDHGTSLLEEIQLSSRKIAAVYEHNMRLKAALTDLEIDADKDLPRGK